MDERCIVHRVSGLLGKKWTIEILLEIYKGNAGKKKYVRRFQEIKNSIPEITAKILSERLGELIDSGIVIKKVDSSYFPIISEYELSKSGLEFISIISQMKIWAIENKIFNKNDSKRCKNINCGNCVL